MAKKTRLAAGFKAQGRAAVYQAAHFSEGSKTWAAVMSYMVAGRNVWLEYDSLGHYEDYET